MRTFQVRAFMIAATFAIAPSTAQARFMQTDPIGYKDQVNLHAYVRNDPINSVDFSGERIQLAIHEVAFDQYHAKIVIIPDDQAAFKNDRRFQTTADGIKILTIGAGPDTSANILGPLVEGLNRPTT